MVTMSKIYLVLLLGLFLSQSFAADCVSANDRYYLLNSGNTARDMGDYQEAVRRYKEYINCHPFSEGTFLPGQQSKRYQYYLRNLLMAYDNLIDVLRDAGQTVEIDLWLSKLKTLYVPERFGAKNTYKLARILQENGCSEDCIPLFERILKEQQTDYIEYNNKVTIRTFSALMAIYATQGNVSGQMRLYREMEAYPKHNFDARDIYNLAATYLKYKITRDRGQQMLEDMLNDMADNPEREDIPVFVKAAARMMQSVYASHDEQREKYVFQQCKVLLNRNLSPQQVYSLALAFLKSGKRKEGRELLQKISMEYQYTVWARKSLFLLGREAMSEENWNSAIEAYSTYIQRYPDRRFFALKAYSNLLDAYWSQDSDLEKQKVMVAKFADIINQVSDYETQLNLSRDLFRKGFDKLAMATFNLGYAAASKVAEERLGTPDAVRARWQMAKYAAALEKYDLVLENGNSVLEQCSSIDQHSLKSVGRKRLNYYQSRTYLWLAKAYENKADYPAATKVLNRFLRKYSSDNDADYVRFELGRLYEETLEYDKATVMFGQISDDRLKSRAKNRHFPTRSQ